MSYEQARFIPPYFYSNRFLSIPFLSFRFVSTNEIIIKLCSFESLILHEGRSIFINNIFFSLSLPRFISWTRRGRRQDWAKSLTALPFIMFGYKIDGCPMNREITRSTRSFYRVMFIHRGIRTIESFPLCKKDETSVYFNIRPQRSII